eukprot:gene1326-2555_t
MKLDEAAVILGVSIDADIEVLKQKYKKIALAWHPDKCNDPKAKEKFQQFSIAYTKMIANRTGDNIDEDDSEDENETGDDDVNEMRAFMRMFMDLVGIFNEEKQSTPERKTIDPPAPTTITVRDNEDWSTEEEDDDDDDDDYDDYESDGGDDPDAVWEPMVKHYFHMNLKEEASKERENRITDGTEKESDDTEAKRKLKNAKKRAEKRRKQKEKKMKEAAIKAEEQDLARRQEEEARKEEKERERRLKEEQRIAQEREHQCRQELFRSVAAGDLDKVQRILNDPDNTSIRVTDRSSWDERGGVGLLHWCVSDVLGVDGPAVPSDASGVKLMASRRNIATYICNMRSPSIDLNVTDNEGRNVLHCAARSGDAELLELLIKERSEVSDKRFTSDHLLINSKCSRLGWTPLHYTADQGSLSACRILIHAGALLNIPSNGNSGRDGHEKGAALTLTPLELVQYRLKSKSIGGKGSLLRAVESELTMALDKLEKSRQLREQERLQKQQKVKEEKQKQTLKEEQERELLERKQKQLKEKQETQRLRDIEEEIRRKGTGTSSTTGSVTVATTTTSSSGSSSTKLTGSGSNGNSSSTSSALSQPLSTSASTVSVSTPAATSSSTSSTAAAMKSKKKKSKDISSGGKKKGDGNEVDEEEEENSASSSSYGNNGNGSESTTSHPSRAMPATTANTNTTVPGPVPVVVTEISSRDEVVDYLMAMGFPEQDCLSAVIACGSDIDRCISWLCEKPTATVEEKSSSSGTTTTRQGKSSSSSSSSSSSQDKAGAVAAAVAAQREKDHKEELRRINREWNAKVPQQRAEEEKKKIEAEKKKAAILQFQKQLQQQQSNMPAPTLASTSTARVGSGGMNMNMNMNMKSQLQPQTGYSVSTPNPAGLSSSYLQTMPSAMSSHLGMPPMGGKGLGSTGVSNVTGSGSGSGGYGVSSTGLSSHQLHQYNTNVTTTTSQQQQIPSLPYGSMGLGSGVGGGGMGVTGTGAVAGGRRTPPGYDMAPPGLGAPSSTSQSTMSVYESHFKHLQQQQQQQQTLGMGLSGLGLGLSGSGSGSSNRSRGPVTSIGMSSQLQPQPFSSTTNTTENRQLQQQPHHSLYLQGYSVNLPVPHGPPTSQPRNSYLTSTSTKSRDLDGTGISSQSSYLYNTNTNTNMTTGDWSAALPDFYNTSASDSNNNNNMNENPSQQQQRDFTVEELNAYLNMSLEGGLELSPGAKPFIPQYVGMSSSSSSADTGAQKNMMIGDILGGGGSMGVGGASRSLQSPPNDWTMGSGSSADNMTQAPPGMHLNSSMNMSINMNMSNERDIHGGVGVGVAARDLWLGRSQRQQHQQQQSSLGSQGGVGGGGGGSNDLGLLGHMYSSSEHQLQHQLPSGHHHDDDDDLDVEMDVLKALDMEVLDDNHNHNQSDGGDGMLGDTSSFESFMPREKHSVGLHGLNNTSSIFSNYLSPSVSSLLGGIGRRQHSEGIFSSGDAFGIDVGRYSVATGLNAEDDDIPMGFENTSSYPSLSRFVSHVGSNSNEFSATQNHPER